MIIADTDAPVRKITDYLAPWGFDSIRYRSAVKAIDNIEEIGPDAVFITARETSPATGKRSRNSSAPTRTRTERSSCS